MYKRNNMKIMIGAFIGLGTIMLVTLIYATFTGQLNINGSAVGRESKWDIHFENVSSITTSGTSKVLNSHQPVINSNNPTQIQDYEVSLTSPSDTISFTFDVVNDGNYNAKITSVNVGTPQCTSTDSVSAVNMCNNLTYSITYASGASIQINDVVNAKDKVSMKVMLTFNDISNASLLPTAGVSISNLGIQINFEQQGNALVKDNGEVADYRVYHQGDKITLNNEDYYIIEDSGAGQDYVVALKDTPLTGTEINLYGGVGTESNYVNRYTKNSPGTVNDLNGYGAVAFYSSETCGYVNGSTITSGCTNIYDDSDIKHIVGAWALDKFQSNELKEVNGYKVRLLKVDEYNILGDNYLWHQNYKPYWSMDCLNATHIAWDFGYNGNAVFTDNRDKARPVINVYKSKISS